MVWVPKLPGALVCDSAEGAAAWGSKIGGQDRLPDDQKAELRVRMAGKKFFGCGGPPQTCCSSGREQEDNARLVCRGVKRVLEFGEVRADKTESGGCPAGVSDGPQRYTPASNSGAATRTAIRSRFLISGPVEMIRQKSRNLLRK